MSYYDLSNLSNSQNIGDLLSLPSTIYPYFWGIILFGLWFIITTNLYYRGKELKGRENILSCMAIASFVILILSVVGTIIGMIPLSIMIYILVLSLLVIIVWFFSGS